MAIAIDLIGLLHKDNNNQVLLMFCGPPSRLPDVSFRTIAADYLLSVVIYSGFSRQLGGYAGF